MKKILIMDDDLEILQVVEEILTFEGFRVKTAADGEHFLQLAEAFQPDLFLLDYLIGAENGGEWCSLLKQHPTFMHTPVVLFSAFSKPGLDFYVYGCNEVIKKPFDLNELITAVARLTKNGSPANAPL